MVDANKAPDQVKVKVKGEQSRQRYAIITFMLRVCSEALASVRCTVDKPRLTRSSIEQIPHKPFR